MYLARSLAPVTERMHTPYGCHRLRGAGVTGALRQPYGGDAGLCL